MHSGLHTGKVQSQSRRFERWQIGPVHDQGPPLSDERRSHIRALALALQVGYWDIEAPMAERGVEVDHATVNRWVVKLARLLLSDARRHKRIRRSS
jgi:hypothetical protein